MTQAEYDAAYARLNAAHETRLEACARGMNDADEIDRIETRFSRLVDQLDAELVKNCPECGSSTPGSRDVCARCYEHDPCPTDVLPGPTCGERYA